MNALTTKAVMLRLGIGRDKAMTIMRAIGYRLEDGHRWRVDSDDLEAYIAECKTKQKELQREPLRPEPSAAISGLSTEEMRIPKPAHV